MKELCICTSFIRRTPLLVAVAAGSALALAPTSFGAGRTLPGNSTSNIGPHAQVKQAPGGIAGGNPACGAAATHDCFTTGTVGCTDEVCCNLVCSLDSFCCASAWDGICVNEAIANCGAVAPANDNCPQRILVGTGDTAFTTIGATTDGPPTACIDVAGDPQVNQDVWFNFFAPTTELYSATTCGSGYDTKMAVYSGCTCPANPGSEVGCNDDACGLQSIVTWNAVAGTCYKIRIGGYQTAVGSGVLHVTAGAPVGPCDDPNNHPCDVAGGPGCSDHDCCTTVCALDAFCCDVSWDAICVSEAAQFCGPPCPTDCPPGSVQEGEPCGSDTNGGCNSTPPVYTQIACGDTVCADFWASGGTRDTDWYQFTITQDQTSVNWSVFANFPAVAFILNNDCGNIVLIAQGTGNCPVRAEATGCSALAAGTYVAFAATASFDGLPCGGKNNAYYAVLTCTAPCLADITGDGVVNSADLLQVINHWGPCP